MLYVHPRTSSFVRKDLAIFEEEYAVKRFEFVPESKWYLPFVFLNQLIFLLKYGWQSKIIVIQFAGFHSVLPVMLGKWVKRPVLLITGGTDCVKFPHISYGNFNRRFLAVATAYSLRNANAISSVHESLQYQAYGYDGRAPKYQGYKHWANPVAVVDHVIYNGYDRGIFFWEDVPRKANSFISVAATPTSRFARELKGLDVFFELAQRHPDWTFTVVGAPTGWQPEGISANVQLLPFSSEAELRKLYNSHQFYVQLSISEGFPNALTEAMFCGCIPLVSQVASMPFIANDFGIVVESRGVEYVEQKLKSFHPPASSKQIAEVTAARFPLNKRREDLLGLLHTLVLAN